MNRRITTGIGGFVALILASTGAATVDGLPAADPPAVAQQVVLTAYPVALGPICLDSAGFGGVYCIWPEQPGRRPARNTPHPPPPPPASENLPPATG